MADFRLGRLKFNWRGAWAASTAYVIDDIVSFKGNTYVCVVNHTSASSETVWYTTDYDVSPAKWQLHVPGIKIEGTWQPNKFYAKNDLISYGANQYLCQVDHTSAANENLFYQSDVANWTVYTESTTYTGEWTTGTWYKVNDIVKYGNTLYLTTQFHTSGIQFDTSKFSVYLDAVKFEDSWDISAEYQPGDIVTFGGYSYVANTINTGKQPNIYNVDIVLGAVVTPADWKILTTGFDVKGVYSNTTVYVPGDVVQFGGDTYVKIATGVAGVYPIDTSAWQKVASGLNWRGPWSSSATYQVNDVVSSTSASWVNLTAHNTNIDPVEDQTVSTEVKSWSYTSGSAIIGEANATYGSEQSPLSSTSNGSGTGATFIVGRDASGDINLITAVSKGTGYGVGDTITISAASINDTTNLVLTLSDIGSGTGGANWQALAQGESTLTLSNPGDILYRNSSGANVNLPIGPEGQVLAVSANGLPAWERNNTCANVFYVATDGTDDPAYGKNISKPWRTLRYALAQTDGLGTASNIITIFVKSGTYEETLPLVTSKYTSIVGDNLRATIIKPNPNTQSVPTSGTITGWTGPNSDENAKENRFSTMFYLTESVTLKDLVMVGMEGFEEDTTPDNDWDILGSNWEESGVFLRLRADEGILGKSPYISQCSAFSGRRAQDVAPGTLRYGGGIGALVDRSVYDNTGVGIANSNGSMLFDSFTQFHDGGVGFWCKDLGNAEVVSCFTYYCHIGYTCTGGGRIRSLSGNNSYGVYGAVSQGTDPTETALEASVRGQRLNHQYDENSAKFTSSVTGAEKFVIQGTPNSIVEDWTATSPTVIGGAAVYSDIATTTSGSGVGATFDVTRDATGTVTDISIVNKGSGYQVTDTITISGADIGGTSPTDDIVLTVSVTGTDFSVNNPNYALALILYKADAGEVDGETTGEDFMLIESVTGTFGNSLPIAACDGNSVLIPNGATSTTKATDALSGIYGSVFTLTDLPVDPVTQTAIIPRKTASVAFLPVVGSPAYDDDDFYTINLVSDDTTADVFSLSTKRRYDVPGANADTLQIQQIQRDSSGVVTVTTTQAHGLVAGDQVTVVVSNSQSVPQFPSQPIGSQGVNIPLQGFNTPAFQRTTVLPDNIGLYTFKYNDHNGVTLATEAYSDAQYLGTGVDISRVYKVSTSGGGTNVSHAGGSEIVLYSVYNQAILLDSGGATQLSADATSLTVQSSSWTNNINSISLQAGTAFLLINNEIIQVDPNNNSQLQAGGGAGSATINLIRGNNNNEGTASQVHSDGSVIYLLTKIPQQTTLKRNVGSLNSSGSSTEIDLPVFNNTGLKTHDIVKVDDEFFRVSSVNTDKVGQATITFALPKEKKLYNGSYYGAFEGQDLEIRLRYSQVRLTGHDFLLIGTGGKADTNWPNQPNLLPVQENEVFEGLPGRVYYTSTDHDGNFRVGNLFEVEQATGSATLNASAFKLSGLTSLRLGTIGAQLGAEINEFSTDINLGGEFSRDSAAPTQLAVKTYVDNNVGSGILRTAPTHTAQQIVSTGVTATFTSFGNHSFYEGDEVVISGVTPATYNGRFTVYNVTSNSFQYTLPTAVAGGAGSGLAMTATRIQKMDTELNVTDRLALKATWNSPGTDFDALKINITDTNSGTGATLIDARVGGASKFSVDKNGNIVASGSLNVQGTLTTVNSTNLTINDKNIIVANGAGNESQADGAGITVGTSGLEFTYNATADKWQLPNAGLNIGDTLQIGGADVVTSSGLGTNITSSSLTSLGTLTGLAVGGNTRLQSVSEKITVVSTGSGDEDFDYNTSAIYFYSAVTADLNARFLNVPSTPGSVHSFVVVLTQPGSGTARKFGNTAGVSTTGNALDGTSVTIKWIGAEQPAGELGRLEAWNFTVINTSSTATPSWTVIGNMSSFG